MPLLACACPPQRPVARPPHGNASKAFVTCWHPFEFEDLRGGVFGVLYLIYAFRLPNYKRLLTKRKKNRQHVGSHRDCIFRHE